MQMAELMIRGGIATQTMANLTQEQIERANTIVEEMTKDPSLAADRVEMCRQLGNTIGGDYRSDRNAALQEFRIALWRATVYLLYHREYKYNCTLCGATEYKTTNDTIKTFDRQYPICPKCNKTHYEIDGADTVCSVQKIKNRHALTCVDNEPIIIDGKPYHKKKKLEKLVRTPIAVVYGSQKYENAEEILKDKIQRRKWYKTWVWNYFKQILNENLIKTHNKHQIDISGPADEIITSLIINELKREKRKFYFDKSSIYLKSEYLEIYVNTYQTPPDFTRFILLMKKAYEDIGIEINLDRYFIKIKRYDAPIINAVVVTENPVIMMSNDSSPRSDSDNDDGAWRDIIEHRTVNINHDGEIDKIDSQDLMDTIREALPEGHTRDIFDIYSQQGDMWDKFSTEWGEHMACKSHIAKFLEINTKEVDAHKEIIKTQCLVYNLSQ